ncbi:HisA/HisF-related TIM barrel protein [Acidiplasma cupricumulans]|uniref:HisA/HisF-related TIM barrel protein n=1 Tax=Acidiplasma cupricumulans TaxID=312540 RepID=UPI00191C377C|nr:HisA/HisF-related TIM barrel protein [Acidiplasma cupricumulans]
MFVQVGGGFRTLNDINNALLIGAGSVIIGTKIMDSGFINSINTDFITASMDVIDGNIAINGWKNISKIILMFI